MKEQFYAERDRRTVEYGLDRDPFDQPTAIMVADDAAANPAGQTATLALVNMAARIHRRLRLIIPDAPLLAPSMVGGTSFGDAAARLVQAIDPYNDIVIAPTVVSFSVPPVAIGVGAVRGVPLAVTADGYRAALGADTHPFTSTGSTVLGAGLAACLGAAALVQLSLHRTPAPRIASLWDFSDGAAAPRGTDRSPGPLDVGGVAVIGAGAVASALAYWIRQIGIVGTWTFVDGDIVELHNTNRSLGLLACHAGWVDGVPGHPKADKADVAAELIGARSHPYWYDDWVTVDEHPDLLLPLANGPGLRSAIGQRGEPVLLHGTTSRVWTSDLNRHLAEEDGCITCRLPERPAAALACSTSPIPSATGDNDAALPFLSGAAGLLLLAGLVHLASGRLPEFPVNQWQLHLDLPAHRTVSSRRWPCNGDCNVKRHLPQAVRRALPRRGRWAPLD